MLTVTDLVRDFEGVQAVAGASFAAERGHITGLIGPNGAGKSTVLTMIAGALKPTSGSIRFDGEELAGRAAYAVARRGIIRTFQISSEFPRLTVMENLLVAVSGQRGESLGGALLGKRHWRAQEQVLVERARELLGGFDMAAHEDEYAGNLSSGQKRLLEITRALMAGPTMLLLDEPMAGVNPSLTRRIEEHLLRLRDQGLSILLVEHELSVVERLCEPIVVMAQGRVIAQGTMDEIRANQDVLDAYLIG